MQDGHNKQDHENQAAKCWIKKYGTICIPIGVTVLGDVLYYKQQPIYEDLFDKGFNVILVCETGYYKSFYEWVDLLEEGVDRHKVTIKCWDGKRWVMYTYQYASDVPLRDTDALRVNWFEVTISTLKVEPVHYNTYVTNHALKDKNVGNLGVWANTMEDRSTIS